MYIIFGYMNQSKFVFELIVKKELIRNFLHLSFSQKSGSSHISGWSDVNISYSYQVVSFFIFENETVVNGTN